MSLCLSTFSYEPATKRSALPQQIAEPIDAVQLKSALFSLPPEFYDSYPLWMKEVALPLKFAGDEYFDLFNEFSRQSAKYGGEDDCRAKWDAIGTPLSGKAKTVASIFYNAKKHGWVPRASSTPNPQSVEERYPTRTMSQLLQAQFDEEYIVDGILIRGIPGIVGGPAKSLKTGQLMDLAYNLSTGGKFLGKFQCKQSNVLVLTGESGGAALQRRLRMLSKNAGNVQAHDGAFLISEALPKFANQEDLRLLGELIELKKSEVVIIDPLYMCMGGGDAGNIQAQGELLWGISDLCRKRNATLLVAHHVTKAAAKQRRPLTLEDLTQAGFDAWARQWILVSRREAFELGSGVHKLQLAVGNCSSHSMEWAVDIDEGTKDSPKWEVTIRTLAEGGREVLAEKLAAKQEADFCKIQKALANGSLSSTDLRNKAGISQERYKVVLPSALDAGVVAKVEGKRKGFPHYALVEPPSIAV